MNEANDRIAAQEKEKEKTVQPDEVRFTRDAERRKRWETERVGKPPVTNKRRPEVQFYKDNRT